MPVGVRAVPVVGNRFLFGVWDYEALCEISWTPSNDLSNVNEAVSSD